MSRLFLLAALVTVAFGSVLKHNDASGISEDVLETARRFISDCSDKDLATCLGIKAVTIINRMARMGNFSLVEGITFVKSGDVDRDGRAMSENELENSLPEDSSEKRSHVIDLLLDAAFRFFKSHSLQLRLPESTATELKRSIYEGRGKIKKILIPLILGALAKVFAVLPLVLGVLAFLALKALFFSKLALLVSIIMIIKRIMERNNSRPMWNTGGGSSGWSGYGNYRNFDESESSHDLAYRAYSTKPL